VSRLAPGHGDVIDEPRPRVQEYVAHRNDRERQVLKLLKAGPARIPDMVAELYADRELHPKLLEAAGWQLHAHLLKLKAEGKVAGTSVKSAWKLA
jgi:glyoxylase-like metal-dependent hydrolase (beta-lactamase superfamily II)